MPDAPIPLATADQLTEGPLANLVAGYSQIALNDLMLEATRICEEETGRRLAPFGPITESCFIRGVDPDEYGDQAAWPIDIQGVVGRSYAETVGASTLVRHLYVDEFAPMYPEYWQYSNVSVQVERAYGGSQIFVAPTDIDGPEPDSGHLWFHLGSFTPIGSLARVTYSGGYSTMPASLVRAGKLMAAHLAVTELTPQSTNHDPEQLRNEALDILARWVRE
jgi:hypothetical protein